MRPSKDLGLHDWTKVVQARILVKNGRSSTPGISVSSSKHFMSPDVLSCMIDGPLLLGALYRLQEKTVSQEQFAYLLPTADKPLSAQMEVVIHSAETYSIN